MSVPGRAYLKRGFFRLLRLSGDSQRRLRQIGERGFSVVLCLHRVSPEANDFRGPMPPRVFEGLLRFLVTHFVPSTLEELGQPTTGGRPRVAVTFDDGYRDFVDHAMPLLRRYRVPVNQNLVASCVEQGRPPWTVELADALGAAPPSLLGELRVLGFARPPPGKDAIERARFGAALSNFLKMRPRAERAERWPEVAAWMARVPYQPTAMMTREDVLALAGEVSFGLHSYSHESMGQESLAFFEDDFARGAAVFQGLGLPLDTYAFPNGSYRPEMVAALGARGVRHVLLVDNLFVRGPGATIQRFLVTSPHYSEAIFESLGGKAQGHLQRTIHASHGQ
jgi:peptidoglycan/xylan/chitin deacetylase (PgdA/CDA1 family)